MVCRQCGTEIAAKAIICYKCGTATALPAAPRPASVAPSYNRLGWILGAVALAAAVAGMIWWLR